MNLITYIKNKRNERLIERYISIISNRDCEHNYEVESYYYKYKHVYNYPGSTRLHRIIDNIKMRYRNGVKYNTESRDLRLPSYKVTYYKCSMCGKTQEQIDYKKFWTWKYAKIIFKIWGTYNKIIMRFRKIIMRT